MRRRDAESGPRPLPSRTQSVYATHPDRSQKPVGAPNETRDSGALLSPPWPAIAVLRERLIGKELETPATSAGSRRPSVRARLALGWFAGMHGEVPCLAAFLKL
jgi:hypothetical protein